MTLVDNVFSHVGIKDADNEPHFQKELRIFATNWACRMGSSECIACTHVELRQNLINLPSNMRATIYCNGLRRSGENFASLKSALEATNDLNERNIMITALGCSETESLLIDYIHTSVEGGYKSQSENYRVFTSVLENGQIGLNVVVEFLENNLLAAAEAYGETNINNAIIAAASNVVSDEIEDKVS